MNRIRKAGTQETAESGSQEPGSQASCLTRRIGSLPVVLVSSGWEPDIRNNLEGYLPNYFSWRELVTNI